MLDFKKATLWQQNVQQPFQGSLPRRDHASNLHIFWNKIPRAFKNSLNQSSPGLSYLNPIDSRRSAGRVFMKVKAELRMEARDSGVSLRWNSKTARAIGFSSSTVSLCFRPLSLLAAAI